LENKNNNNNNNNNIKIISPEHEKLWGSIKSIQFLFNSISNLQTHKKHELRFIAKPLRTSSIWNKKVVGMQDKILNLQSYKPVVTRFFCPPETPLSISVPTAVSAHRSSPSTLRT